MTVLSGPRLLDHLQEMTPDVAWVEIDSLRGGHAVACVDGRNHDCVAATPGGNAGLFVLLLAAMDQVLPETLMDEDVASLFEAYLDRFGQFYLHSDTHAVDQLFGLIASELDVGPLPDSPDEQAAFLRNPPSRARPLIREVAGDPPYIGCGHLRLVAAHPDTYGVPRRMLRILLRRFFSHLWEGDSRCEFDVLKGPHAEQAVVRMYGPENALPPLPHPQYHRRQLFIHHPEVVHFMEPEHAQFLVDDRRLMATDILTFVRAHRDLADVHLHTTLSLLAPKLPVYDVRWTEAGIQLMDG